MKVRFVEPSNRPYRPSLLNHVVYDRSIRNPSQGVITLATIAANHGEDSYAYSESISEVDWDDVLTADVVFLSIFTFAAERGYLMADLIREASDATVVIGGLHATLVPEEAVQHADYVMVGEGDETLPLLLDDLRAGRKPSFQGVAWLDADGGFHTTGTAEPPTAIDTIPNRYLMHNFKEMTRHNTIWPQVHASRGCPHSCDYCGLVAAFGRSVRTRTPEVVVQDIKEAIRFFDEGNHRIAKMLWITDDNFFVDRAWALSVLRLMVESGIDYNFTIQVRYEVGFDDEMLDALKAAGFSEVAMGIEFIEDEAFELNHKKSSVSQIKESIRNIQAHGLRVRGLFVLGADNHTPGISERIAQFVAENDINGVLLQSMYFVPGTRSYDEHVDDLIQGSPWSRCIGKVVHHPKNMSARELQQEVVNASNLIYSPGNLAHALAKKRGIELALFLGEYLWQFFERHDLLEELRANPSILDE